MSKPKKHALDIFRTLGAIDRHDLSYYQKLSSEEKKGYQSPVVMRWVSAKEDHLADWNLIVTNERANIYHYDLYEHADLQYRLLASIGMKERSRSTWIAGPKKDNNAAFVFLRKYYPEANTIELETILLHMRRGDNLREFLNGTGMTPDEAKRIEKLIQ